MSLVKQTFKIDGCNSEFDCYILTITDSNGNTKFWFKGSDTAEVLGYKLPHKAIMDHVIADWKRSWVQLRDDLKPITPETPKNWQPHTIFISEDGLHALIGESKKSEAIKFQKWMFEEVLPSIRKTGKYDISQKNNENVQLQVSQDSARFMDLEKRVDGTSHQYQLKIIEITNNANLATIAYGLYGLLAQHNMKENDDLRKTLANISDRVVPSLTNQPDKDPYLTCYTYPGSLLVKVTRCQNKMVEERDRILKRMNDNTKTKRVKMDDKYEWLRGCEKFHQVKCPNPIMLWNEIKQSFPYFTFGFRFKNRSRTEIEFLSETDLRDKYFELFKIYEKVWNASNSAVISKREKYVAKEFESLNFADVNDAVQKCLTPTIEVKEKVIGVINSAIEEIHKESEAKSSAIRDPTKFAPTEVKRFLQTNRCNIQNATPYINAINNATIQIDK